MLEMSWVHFGIQHGQFTNLYSFHRNNYIASQNKGFTYTNICKHVKHFPVCSKIILSTHIHHIIWVCKRKGSISLEAQLIPRVSAITSAKMASAIVYQHITLRPIRLPKTESLKIPMHRQAKAICHVQGLW